MGKASRKKKKLIQEDRGEQIRDLKSSKTSGTLQQKKEPQKSSSRTRLLLIIFIILFSSVAVYFNSLSNDFVYDDKFQVLENRWIKDIKYIPDIFFKNVWGFRAESAITNYYRPLMHIIYMFNYYVFGLRPWGFHLVNILFHAGVSVLVFIVTLRLLDESQPSASNANVIPSFVAALLFATHPIHTEAVTWIAGLPDLSFTFFYLLSFYLYIRSGRGFKSSYFLSVASFFLAAFCKEPALTLPVILIAYDYSFKRSRDRLSIQVKRYIPYLIVAGVYFILRFHALTGLAPLKRHTELSIYQDIINIFPLFSQYLQKLVLPTNLNAFYVFHPIFSIAEAKGILTFVIVTAFFVFVLVTFRRNRAVFFSLLLIIIPLLPVLYIPALGENSFTERYLYLPSFGFISLFALLLIWAKVNRPTVAVSLIVVSTIVIGLYSLGTVRRNTIWKDDYILYSDMVIKSPDGAIPHHNLGLSFFDKGKIDEAIEEYQIALRIEPAYEKAHTNLGKAFFDKGRIDEAIEQFQTASALDADSSEPHGNLGAAFVRKGWIDKAIEQCQIALKLKPDYVDAHNSLGAAFYNKGWIDKAIEQYQIVLRLNPDYANTHSNLGVIFFNKGQMDKAIEHYQTALKINPDYADAHNNLGNALFKKGQIDKAIEQYREALRLNPDSIVFKTNLERVYNQRRIGR